MTLPALPHLIFLTLMFVAAVAAWAWQTRRHTDVPLMIAGAVVAGVGCGIFLGAWT